MMSRKYNEQRPKRTHLAKRALACEAFRWMPGMLMMEDERGYAERILNVGLKESSTETASQYSRGWRVGDITLGTLQPGALPDLDDPATLGCLLFLVRSKDEVIDGYLRPVGQDEVRENLGGFFFCYGNSYDEWSVIWGPTEAEALVLALEMAGPVPVTMFAPLTGEAKQ